MKQLVKKNGFSVVNEPPAELNETFAYYKDRLKAASQAPYILSEEERIQLKVPVSEEEFYTMEWVVPKLEYLVSKEKLSKTVISIDRLKSSIQQAKGGKLKNRQSSVDESVLIAFYPPISSKYVILKGVDKAIRLSDSGAESMDAYVLEPYIHLQGTAAPIHRTLFAIHYNHSLLCSYIAGKLPMDELETRIFPVY